MIGRTIRNQTALALLIALSVAAAAYAQTPVLTPSTLTVTPGGSVSATVTGAAGRQYAVIGSTTSSGFAYGGVNLAVGPDVVVLASGVLNAGGTASVAFTPPFQGNTPARYFTQAVTSTSPNFVPLTAGASVVLQNAAVVGSLPIVAIGNPNGTLQFGSQGVSISRNGPGSYRINYAGLVTAPFVPLITPIGARILGSFYSATGIDLTLDVDAFFTVLVFPVRP